MTPQNPSANLASTERLALLQQTGLLDSEPEESFDRVTALAAKAMKAPVSLVSLVDDHRQFFKSHQGLPEAVAKQRETPLSHSFCQHVVSLGRPLIIEDATADPLLLGHPLVKEFGVGAYIGVPLTTSKGHTLGSLCVLDFRPRQWTGEDVEILRGLAGLTMLEIELRLNANQFQDQIQRCEEAGQRRKMGARLIVHDLRTPLNSLLMGLQAVPLLGSLNAEQRECLELADRGGQNLLSMINQLLDLDSLESQGAAALHLEAVAPAELIRQAVAQVSNLASRKDFELRVDFPPGLPLVWADVEKLVRVLTNLLGNAIKFTPRGAVTVSARAQADQPFVLFSVRDTGVGLALRDQERIFDAFYQAHHTAMESDSSRSTGLGLTFCKIAVESHGGRIWVESELGRGSVFSFSVPVRGEIA